MPISKEERRIYNKKYYGNHKEESKKYYEKHKEEIKKYNKTPKGKKSNTITNWKYRGLICEDYDSLYCHYINSENCEECNVIFGVKGDGTGTFKCMDHDHQTGQFRAFLCSKCNVARGE